MLSHSNQFYEHGVCTCEAGRGGGGAGEYKYAYNLISHKTMQLLQKLVQRITGSRQQLPHI
jgi:hypothetical protein